MIWLTDSIKFGASYRSEVSYSINGKLTFSPNAPGFPDTGFTSSIKTPANAFLGLAWTHDSLTLEFDAQWTDWSSWSEIAADFNQPVGGQPGISVEEDWHDAWAYRFGAQFAVNQYLDVRAGIAYDESPIPSRSISPRLFAGDLWYYTVGLGGHFKGFDADLAYQYVDVESRKMGSTAGNDQVTGVFGTPQLTGKFKDVDAHIIAFNLSYKF
jgi:long-chain fatty acid transport protein